MLHYLISCSTALHKILCRRGDVQYRYKQHKFHSQHQSRILINKTQRENWVRVLLMRIQVLTATCVWLASLLNSYEHELALVIPVLLPCPGTVQCQATRSRRARFHSSRHHWMLWTCNVSIPTIKRAQEYHNSKCDAHEITQMPHKSHGCLPNKWAAPVFQNALRPEHSDLRCKPIATHNIIMVLTSQTQVMAF